MILLVMAAVTWWYFRILPVRHKYQEDFGKVDRLVINGVQVDTETGKMLPLKGEITNTAAITSLSNSFFAGTQVQSSLWPPVLSTRLHTSVRGYRGREIVCEFEVYSLHRVFFDKRVWADIPGADLPERIKEAFETNNLVSASGQNQPRESE